MKRTLLVTTALLAMGCLGTIDAPEGAPAAPVEPPSEPAAQNPPVATPASPADENATVRLARSSQFGAYLTDRAGRPLYMYVGDTAGTQLTACLGDCARDFPPFDTTEVVAGAGIDAAELTRFHRQDGAWQTTYKGYPLYQRASEAGRTEVTSDGFTGRWYLAKDYLTFLSLPKNFEPAGDEQTDAAELATYLVDGYGRTLYVCLDDRPADAGGAPQTSCTGPCIATRPPLSTGASSRTEVLPVTVDAADLTSFTRPDGAPQLMFRGWPLYYFAGDARTGDTIGHNQRAWRAIDPRRFPGSLTSTGVVLRHADEANDD